MPSTRIRKRAHNSTSRISERTGKQRSRDNPGSWPGIASQWERIRACRNGSGASEHAQLEQLWRDNREAWLGLSRLECIENFVQEIRDLGFNNLVCDLARIAFAKNDYEFYQNTVLALERMGLHNKDWRQKLKSELPRQLDLLRVLVAQIEIEGGASERRAAERAAALFGGSASFDAAAQAVREKLRDGRTLQEALELLCHREDNRRKSDDTLAISAAELNLRALNRRRICW
jgi:hypothetical protein